MKNVARVLVVAASLACGGAGAQYGYSQSCADATDDAESAASALVSAASYLESCASSEDFEDDCSSQFYDVESAHSDYESAVAEVETECD